jgi:hypothetical protein
LRNALQAQQRTDSRPPNAEATLRLVENVSVSNAASGNRRIQFGILVAAVLAVSVWSLVVAVGESRQFSLLIDDAVAIAANDPRVVTELGDAIAVSGPASRREVGQTTPVEVRATVPVKGSLRPGNLHIVATREDDRWKFSAVILEVERRFVDIETKADPS